MRRARGRPLETEVSLVESVGGGEVAHLQGNEVGSGDGHEISFCVSYLTQMLCQNTDMTQERIDLDTSLGYLLKEAASALRAAMEEVLRPLGMTITHYSCLELLAQRPGSSNSELARGAFVTRQSMNVLLQALESDGVVERPATAPSGKALPTRLTTKGRRALEVASTAVRDVERRMLSGMTDAEQAAALRALRSMVSALRS